MMKIVENRQVHKGVNYHVAFPEAIGNVDTDLDDLSLIKEKLISGELVVEVIDIQCRRC